MIKDAYELLNKHGGRWLGVMREFLQCKAINGDHLSWGSNDWVQFRSITVSDVEHLAARITYAALTELNMGPLLKDLEYAIEQLKQADPRLEGKWFSMHLRLNDLKNRLPQIDSL